MLRKNIPLLCYLSTLPLYLAFQSSQTSANSYYSNYSLNSDDTFSGSAFYYDIYNEEPRYYRSMSIQPGGKFTFNGGYGAVGSLQLSSDTNSIEGPKFIMNSGEFEVAGWDNGLRIGSNNNYSNLDTKMTINDGIFKSSGTSYLWGTFEQNGGLVQLSRLNREGNFQNNQTGYYGEVGKYYLNGGVLRLGTAESYQTYENYPSGDDGFIVVNSGTLTPTSSSGTLDISNVRLNAGFIGKESENPLRIKFGNLESNGGVITAQEVQLSTVTGTNLNIVGAATNATGITDTVNLVIDGDLSLSRDSSNSDDNSLDYTSVQKLKIKNLETNGGTAYFDRGGIDSTGTIITNNSTWEVNNADVNAPDAIITNNGLINGGLKLSTDKSVINNGTMTVGAQNLRLDALNNTTNFGNMVIGVGGQINVERGSLVNNGQITLDNSIINGQGDFNNSYGGYLSGSGTVLNDFENFGTVSINSNALYFAKDFNNHGFIAVNGVSAAITGGDITNTGTINGYGNISNNINNEGTISAANDTMILGGSVSNGTNGLITAATGGQVLALQGLDTNNGVINLTGGVVDNNNHEMTNESQVSGYGTLRTGGLTNNGSVHLTGGTTTVHGDVTNDAHMQVSYDAAIFTGDVVNNGVFKTTDTTVTFTGSYTENGAYISDPSDNYFFDLTIGESGHLFGGVGDNWYVSGDLVNNSEQASEWYTSESALLFNGAGSSLMTLTGVDLGTDLTGTENNFMWGEFHIADGVELTLTDSDLNGDAALYVGLFDFEGEIDFVGFAIDSISSEFNIYYDLDHEENAYLGGGTFSLNGAGSLIGMSSVPLPASAYLFLSGLFGMGVLKRKK